VYYGLLMHPLVTSSRVLARLKTLSLLHGPFPSATLRDIALSGLFLQMHDLESLHWDVKEPGMNVESIPEEVLRHVFGETSWPSSLLVQSQFEESMSQLCKYDQACRRGRRSVYRSRVKDITIRAYHPYFQPLMKNWVRTYTRHRKAWVEQGENLWLLVEENC
jgi:hypothetical protein